jgi:hypothetical protein
MWIRKRKISEPAIVRKIVYPCVFYSMLGFVLLSGLVGACGYYRPLILCSEPIMSQKEAIEIGNKKFKNFFEMDGIVISEILPPEISSTSDIPWIMDYGSRKEDKFAYFVRVTIDSCGAIETSGESW